MHVCLTAGDWQHLGRAGVAGTTRYAAHDFGLPAEVLTQPILQGYMKYQDPDTGVQAAANPRMLVEQTLEDFYEMSENYYPAKLDKYPSFNKTRAQTAPPGNRPLGATLLADAL